MTVRPAKPADADEIVAILDAAMLAFDRQAMPAAIDHGDAFLAVRDDTPVGALLLEGDWIEAIAVRPFARDQGHGRAMVEAALDSRERLVAVCDASERPFYESLGFTLEERDDGRWRGVRER